MPCLADFGLGTTELLDCLSNFEELHPRRVKETEEERAVLLGDLSGWSFIVMEGRNGLIMTIHNVPSNKNPRCTLFRLSYKPMKMASLGTRLSLATTCVIVSVGLLLYFALAPAQQTLLPMPQRDNQLAKSVDINSVGAKKVSQQLASQESSGGMLLSALLCIIFILLMVTMQLRSMIVEESLLVNRDLGVQIEAVRLDGRRTTRFLDKHAISAFVLNEGFRSCRIVCYLSFIVRGQDDLVLAFCNSPGISVLQKVYRRARGTLQLR